MNLPVGDGQAQLHLGSDRGAFHGLECIEGRYAKEAANPTHVEPGTLLNDHEYELLISVRLQDDDAAVTVELDGERLMHWHGPQKSIGYRFYEGPFRIQLIGQYRLDAADFRPLPNKIPQEGQSDSDGEEGADASEG
jgi:hypothetical protein